MQGQCDDLGGGVYKKRLGKNLFRSLIVAKSGLYWVFQFLFAKQDRADIDKDELAESPKLTKQFQNSAQSNGSPTRIGWRFAMKTKAKFDPKFKSDAYEAIHSSASALYRIGAIDQATMREFDESCLAVPAPLAPKSIKKIRLSQKVSQPVFARYLNTSESTIEKWESGAKKPSGMALKLLSIVQKHGLQILA